MKKHLPLILCLLTLIGCGHKTILNEERTFQHNIWNRFTPEQFQIDVHNSDTYYNITIDATIDTSLYRYSTLPLNITLTSPNGEHRTFRSEVILAENNRPKGEMHNGYRQVSQKVRTYFSFNSKGKHQLDIAQGTSQYDLEGIHSLKVLIDKAPLELPD